MKFRILHVLFLLFWAEVIGAQTHLQPVFQSNPNIKARSTELTCSFLTPTRIVWKIENYL